MALPAQAMRASSRRLARAREGWALLIQSANLLVHKYLQHIHSIAGSRRPLSLIAQYEV